MKNKEGCELSSSEYECAFVKDISSKKKTAEEFMELAVKEKLAPIHLSEAVYNFICR